ncbi:hypothetical protein [Larkinella sp.]|uniref:hypothetical protein n=1 Tax=Larkinella sp. TaxID=2034517 RepID=UPI003BAD5849
MKDFPRLHSLHTLNIRHHQNADYLLHQLRTDFIGESGAGKSIIADLLQLIFVGPREYRSATQSLDDERKPKTLLLPSAMLGYAFLNIETAEGEYVVIGVQIEDVHHGVRLFAIQQGFELDDLSRLTPFADPIKVKDLLLDDDVLPLAELANHLEKRGLLVKPYPSTKAYHALLYRSELLPFDLASSEQSLKTYAKIIQAFSRRKSLDPKKPKELIDFLFGNDKGQENYRQYEELMRSVERDDEDYRLNQSEVEQIKEKEKELKALRVTQKRFLEAKRVYNLALLQDAYERRRLTKQKLYKALENFTISKQTMEHWQAYCQQQRANFKKGEAPLVEAEQNALTVYTEKLPPFHQIQQVKQWMVDWNSNFEELPQHYKQYSEAKSVREAHQELRKVFVSEESWQEYENSGWVNGWEQGVEWSAVTIKGLEDDKYNTEVLRDFSDVNDSTTLCHWAYHCEYDFDIYDISVFIGLMTVYSVKPSFAKTGTEYLSNPTELFEHVNNSRPDKDSNGFYLNFKGLSKYFQFRYDLIDKLTTHSNRQLFLKKQSQFLGTNLQNIRNKIKKVKALREQIDALGERKVEILNAYAKRDQQDDLDDYVPFHLSQKEFDTYYNSYTNRESIKAAYKNADKTYKTALNNLQTLKTNISLLISHTEDHDSLHTPYVNTANLVEQYIRERANDFVRPMWEAPKTDFPFTINFQSAKTALLTGQLHMLPLDEWENLDKICQLAEKHYNKVESRYKALYDKLPLFPIEQNLGGIEQCWNYYTKAESLYEAEYKGVAKRFLGDYTFELEGIYDYVILVNYVFTKLIDNPDADEETALVRVTQRLTEVLNHIRNLNKRRLNQISEVLEKVVEDWRKLRNNLKRLAGFFEDPKHHITGGHRVKLTFEESATFPIKWINEFRRELATSHDFADQFINQITFEEKLIAVFKACSGVRNFTPEIRDLLNPNSYFSLNFSIISVDNGKKNDGSTGQTYAAIALLCIARLSLIGRVRRKGIRFMSIDEAEGLGSNYDMLYDIARNNDYQLISMSINLVGSFKEGDQYVHMLQRDLDSSEPINYTPYSIFSKADLDRLLDEDVQDDPNETDSLNQESSENNIENEETGESKSDNNSYEDDEPEEGKEEPTA